MNEYKKINIFDFENKIKSVKNNDNKGIANTFMVWCRLSGQKIAKGCAVCLNIKNNNTIYVSDTYLTNQIFENLNLSKSYKIDILTLIYLGAIVENTNNGATLQAYNNYNDIDDTKTYSVDLKNGLVIHIFDNDAKSIKYWNLLKNYKSSIANIYCYSLFIINHYDSEFAIADNTKKITLKNWSTYIPSYLHKKFEFARGIGYNPDSKKSVVLYW